MSQPRELTFRFPTREQAIVIDAIEDGTEIKDYVYAVGSKVGPKNIIFSSKMCHNTVCVYLSNSELVVNLIGKHLTLQVNGRSVLFRRLKIPSPRLILSNIPPIIPHRTIEHALERIGMKLKSAMKFLPAEIPASEYSHVLSFKREINIYPYEEKTLPSSMVVEYGDVHYKIYLTIEDMRCFLCQRPEPVPKRHRLAQNEESIPKKKKK